jgi:chromate transport protein ChrA
MKSALLVLGTLGVLAGLVMTVFLGISAREIRDTQVSLIQYGLLIAVVSLVILFVAKIISSQRN